MFAWLANMLPFVATLHSSPFFLVNSSEVLMKRNICIQCILSHINPAEMQQKPQWNDFQFIKRTRLFARSRLDSPIKKKKHFYVQMSAKDKVILESKKESIEMSSAYLSV